jgi:hypothetical protein
VPEISCIVHARRAIRYPNKSIVCAFRKGRFEGYLAWQGNDTREWEQWCGFLAGLGKCRHIPAFQSLPMIIYVLVGPKTAYFCASQNMIRNVSPDWINFWFPWNLPDICLKNVSLPICWPPSSDSFAWFGFLNFNEIGIDDTECWVYSKAVQVASDDGYNGILNNEIHDFVEPNYMSWVVGRTVELFSECSGVPLIISSLTIGMFQIRVLHRSFWLKETNLFILECWCNGT